MSQGSQSRYSQILSRVSKRTPRTRPDFSNDRLDSVIPKASARWVERLPSSDPRRTEADQDEAVSRALASVPRQAIIASHPISIATSRDKVGLMTAGALINGQAQTV